MSSTCPYCEAVRTFPGFGGIYAFICGEVALRAARNDALDISSRSRVSLTAENTRPHSLIGTVGPGRSVWTMRIDGGRHIKLQFHFIQGGL
jgi:hypothetical protein